MPAKTIHKTRLVMFALVLLLMQAAVINRFSFTWGKPALLCLLGAFIALYAPMPELMWGVLAIGILRDCGSIGQFGISSLAILPATGVIISLRDRFYRGTAMDILLVLAFMLVFSLVEALGVTLFDDAPSLAVLGRVGAGQSLLTTFLAFPFFYFAERTGVVQTSEESTIFAR